MKTLAFTGTHSSGKSTLINKILKYHQDKRIKIIDGITKNVIQRGYPLAKEANIQSYINYVRDQLREERLVMQNEFDLLLLDRAVIDAAAYSIVNSRLPRPFVPPYFIEMLLEIALMEALRFDTYVFCTADFPMEPQKKRPDDEDYRQDVNDQILDILKTYQLPFILVEGNIQKRLNTINKILDSSYG